MHNNFYFLRQLSKSIKSVLADARLLECFSQNKDEIVLVFLKPDNSLFYLLANLGSDFSCLTFPKDFNKAKRNTAALFTQLNGAVVQNITQKSNERAFTIYFHNGYSLLFKLFGNRSNLILFDHRQIVSIFKNNLKADKTIDPNELNKSIDTTMDHFIANNWELRKVLFTLGPLSEQYLINNGYNQLPAEEKYQLIRHTLILLEDPHFYVTKVEDRVVLSLFHIGSVIAEYDNPIEAIRAFYFAHFQINHLEKQRAKLKNKISENIKGTENYLNKLKHRMEEIKSSIPYSQIADILMANLHLIPKGANTVTLFDFYRNNDLEIKLKKDLSPQKNAEQLYRKEKNRFIEITNLQAQIESKTNVLKQLIRDSISANEITDFKGLEYAQKSYEQVMPEKSKTEIKFKHFEFDGFKIFVGRNAGNNDELTQKFAHKDDLWLHAKDVVGSHVIIRHQAGKNFPRNVIEKAASVAGFYSKRKNESLCPVIFTLKKYVRKVKGAPKGAVKIEKENILMVVPEDF